MLVLPQPCSGTSSGPSDEALRVILQKMEVGNFGEAAQSLEELIRASGADKPAYYYYLGYCQLRLTQYSKALESFYKAPMEGPYWTKVQAGLGIAYFSLGCLDEAAETFKRVLAQEPKEIEALFFLAKVFQQERRYEEAAEYYRRVLDDKPDHMGALYGRGQCLIRLGQMIEGRKVLEDHAKRAQAAARQTVLQRTDGLAEDFWELAHAYLRKGNHRAALGAIEQFVALRPDSERPSLFLAQLSFSQQDYLGAEIHLLYYLKKRPLSFRAWLLLGRVYRGQRDDSKAWESFEKARQIDPDNPALQKALGEMKRDREP